MAEQVFFEQGAVKVTSSRLIIGSRTYAMSQLSSVGSAVESPSRWAAYVLAVAGVFFMIGNVILGAVIVAGSAIWLASMKDKHHQNLLPRCA